MKPYFKKSNNSIKFMKPHPHIEGKMVEMSLWDIINEFGIDAISKLIEKYPVREDGGD